MIKDFTPRLYQQTILGTAANFNTLAVLPTGLGKTALAFLLAAQRLHSYPNSKILMLAPTKPLCEQHVQTFRNHLEIDPKEIVLFTGSVKPEKREEMWKEATVVVSTPQCVSGDTIIYTKKGLMKIKDFVESFNLVKKRYGEKNGFCADINEQVLGYTEGDIKLVNASKCWKLPASKLISIKTEMKNNLKCTPEHPLLTINEEGEVNWTKAEDLEVGSHVAKVNRARVPRKKIDLFKLFSNSNLRFADKGIINNLFMKLKKKGIVDKRYYNYKGGSMPLKKFFLDAKKVGLQLSNSLLVTNKTGRSKPITLPKYLSDDLAYIIGTMLADGHIGNRSPKHGMEVVYSEMFYDSIADRFSKKIYSVFGIKPSSRNFKDKGLVYYSTALALILEKLGVPRGNKTRKIRVPTMIFNAKKSEISSFVSGIINADGDFHRNIIRVCSVSKNFIIDLRWLLLVLGICSSMEHRKSSCSKIGERKINCSDSYHLLISGRENVMKILSFNFIDESKCKRTLARIVLTKRSGTRSKDVLPVKKALNLAYKEHRKNGGKVINDFRRAYHSEYLSKNYLKKNLPLIKSKRASELLNVIGKPFRWVKIKEISHVSNEEFVYDLTVEKDHNFVTNLLVSHNTVENDVINKRVKLEDTSLLVLDESHHATGDYAYVWLAQQYEKVSSYARILALTASPGSDLDKVKEICTNLMIEKVEVRTEKDNDVKPYIQKTKLDWIKVGFPEEFRTIQKHLKDCRLSKLLEAEKYGYCSNTSLTKGELLKLQGELQKKVSSGLRDFELLKSISLVAEALKVEHALELLETQGITQLNTYLKKVQTEALTSKIKAVKNLSIDQNFKSASYLTESALERKIMHPKLIKLKEILLEEASQNLGMKIIIFTQFRDSAEEIVASLDELRIKNHIFVGQAKKNGLGFSQKRQKEILDKFREGEFSVLIATSVAEEGLDIPKVDKVIFYEPIPSAIRSIQRRGRTGRLEKGEVTVLVTEKTRDEAYRWSAHHKEKRMYRTLEKMKKEFSLMRGEREPTLKKFISEEKIVAVLADHREKDNKIIRELIDMNVSVKTGQLESADYLVSGRVGVELKKVPDFVASIIDGRLLEQVRHLRRNFDKAVLVIEGDEDIYSVRKVHANAIRGMLSSIVLDFSVPVLYTKNAKDTAGLLAVMAKREQDKDRDFSYHASKPRSMEQQQEFIVSALPGIGVVQARNLLNHFGSIKKLVNASKEELVALEGVGDKTAERLLGLFDGVYSQK